MSVLITGATGFVGKYLMEALQGGQENVIGTSQSANQSSAVKQVDLLDYASVKTLMRDANPATVYHLAAFASPALSFQHPAKCIGDTLTMQINLFQACLELKITPKFLIVSSGQIYGHAALPITEATPTDLSSPYAVAKAGQENLAHMYAKQGFEVIIARPFNHIGPGQQPGFLVADLAKQIAELEITPGKALRVGNLTSKRDFTDVRDIVRAYVLLVDKGDSGEVYNVCSGKSVAGQDILQALLSLSSSDIKTEEDATRMRPSDIPDLYGDAAKLRAATGWQPQIPLSQTLQETLDYWRKQVIS